MCVDDVVNKEPKNKESDNCDEEPTKPKDPKFDLQITKDVDPAVFANQTGKVITWTINYKNNGPDTAYNVVIADVLPESLRTIVGMSMEAGSIEPGGKVTWNIGTLTAGQTGQIIIKSEYE